MAFCFLDVSFTAIDDGNFVKVKGGEIFSGKKILVCSMPRYLEPLDHLYIKYLREIKDRYQDQFDQLILLNSNHIFALASFDNQWPDLSGYFDHDQEFIKLLSKKIGKNEPVDTLARRWKYQTLIKDGKVEFFIDHPVNDYIGRLGEKFKSDAEFKQLLSSDNPQVKSELKRIFQNPQLFINKNNYGYVHEKILSQKLFYFDLWPATDLTDHLNQQ